ncbi:unnamed protein product [Tilletia laevis]|uniref:Efficient mitochondria targeting-associated protein 19 n=2 Tax=Tilletia TaxID=13289 RepID=A0A177V6D8_9BASI|nr:hypothetical protein CF336_g6514 [Tilletia laevis]KAE8255457.1 hypothetical protein A4X03_0g5561 [Tilletia caries]CAD6914110.1 unnamed protein product [Tilletia controversa]KAE8192554.1 hypothetical protein CF335_g5811 [Tilletia laevis]CAD6885123.1 unnamed protein product [Tilletia caries]
MKTSSRPRPRPLLRRPLDLFYVVFLSFHLLASLLVDGQTFYPSSWVPAALVKVKADYLRDSNDPLIKNALSLKYVWFWTAMVLEFVIQVPAFALGAWALVRDDKRFYPLLIAYSSCAAVTTLQCLLTVLLGSERKALSDDNLRTILGSYVPFFLIPTVMLVDFTYRATSIIVRAERTAAEAEKAKAVKSR